MYDYHSSLPDRYTSYMFYPNDRTLSPSFQNWVRLHKASHVPSTGSCRHPQSTLEPTGRCFRFLLAFVKQTLFALNFATCPAVSSFPVISSPATPRHATPQYCIYALLWNLQMAPRKSHRKTRSGCAQCKRRKVKVNPSFRTRTSL